MLQGTSASIWSRVSKRIHEAEAARPVPRHHTTQKTHRSAESRIKELNKLKADGDITEDEYQKKEAVDSQQLVATAGNNLILLSSCATL